MKKIILTILLSLLPTNANAIQNGTIHSGDPKVVYLASSQSYPGFFCSGALIKENIVVTAAHCVSKPNTEDGSLIRQASDVWVGMPNTNPYKDVERIQAKEIIFKNYKNYWSATDIRTMVGDIAFIILSKPMISGYSVKIANKEEIESLKLNNISLRFFGYGRQKYATMPDGNVYFIDISARYKKFNYEINAPYLESHSIIGDETKQYAICAGDSGGPSFYKNNNDWILVGVTSAGSGCINGDSGGGALSTVVYQYIDWISEKTNEQKVLNNIIETKKVSTIICLRNKSEYKITRINPKCPRGWVKK
jgi:secreted trypsin-like serine protease